MPRCVCVSTSLVTSPILTDAYALFISLLFETCLFGLTISVAFSKLKDGQGISQLYMILFRDGILYSLLYFVSSHYPITFLARLMREIQCSHYSAWCNSYLSHWRCPFHLVEWFFQTENRVLRIYSNNHSPEGLHLCHSVTLRHSSLAIWTWFIRHRRNRAITTAWLRLQGAHIRGRICTTTLAHVDITRLSSAVHQYALQWTRYHSYYHFDLSASLQLTARARLSRHRSAI
jgi:hypothetical protein